MAEMTHAEHFRFMNDERNSMFYWYPKLAALRNSGEGLGEIKMPKTHLKEIGYSECYQMYEPESKTAVAGWNELVDEIGTIIARDFSYPVFIRTDLAAAKHDWRKTCFVENHTQLSGNLKRLLEDNYLKDISPRGFVIREMLSLVAEFCAFEGMPIAREFRFFAEGGEITHVQPYFPVEAIQFWREDCPEPKKMDWRKVLADYAKLSKPELKLLSGAAARISAQFPEEWSIDFCQHCTGKWFITDMALGAVSYRYDPSKPAEPG